ncbi:MAG: ABC-type multidrug transport system, ATPase and permease component [Ferruginibacter sp.]|nr:ABC-type multidrug transport system, ATPase and permease component [Ferruginibacter sp.]
MKTIHVYKRLFDYVGQYKVKLGMLIGISLLGVLFEVVKPLPVKIVLDNVLANHPLPSIVQGIFGHSPLLNDKTALLLISIAALVVITISSAVLSLIAFNATVNLSQGLVYDLSVDFFSKLQRLSLRFHAKNKIGDLLQRMNGDVFVVYFVVAQILIPSITSLVCLAGMFYVMVKIDLVLALIAFTVVPLLGVSLGFFARPMNDTTMDQYTKHGQLSAFVQQSLSSMKIIQAFGREPFMFRKMKEHTEIFSNAFKVANKVSMFYNQLSLLFTSLIAAVVIGVGGNKVLHGALSVGDLFVFLGYIAALNGPVTALSNAIGTGVTIGARGKRIFDIIDSKEVVIEKSDAVPITNASGNIEFKAVTFGYGDEDDSPAILKKISFSTKPGQIVAIVGPTGAGKTSLISLITRFYDPWQGQVLMDGIDIRDLKLHSLREQISMVLQEPFLFPMTIGENIAFGNPEASFDEIVTSAKAAQAHDFIMELPEQYNTLLIENGASLSGGQKQRLSIARAFLKNAPIVILDEPTSAVDSLTEFRIFKELSEFAKGKTLFLISHRLSTLKHADQIITIKDGSVVEQGTHQSLLDKNDVYADLYKHQHIN